MPSWRYRPALTCVRRRAVGIVGLTAFSVVELAEIGPADRVLVLAGSGSVGLSAISYAASKGAKVWGPDHERR